MNVLDRPRTRPGRGKRGRLKAIVVTLRPFARPHRRLASAESGTIGTNSLFSVMAHLLLLLLHRPAVRSARQITRVGSLTVSARHLGVALTDVPGRS